MKIKILILGSTGMAGHMLTKYLEENSKYEIINLSHTKKLNNKSIVMDVTNINQFDDLLNKVKPNIIINCIGILNQYADMYKDKAIFLNSYLPHYLHYKYLKSDVKIIHISTDCVFSGKDGQYTENDFKDGNSFYARTKAIGEIDNKKDLTIRTSIIGPDLNYNGIGLFNWFMLTKGNINGYVNAIWSGITTIELSKAINYILSKSNLSGIYHLVSSEPITKYKLLNLFKAIFNKEDVEILKFKNSPKVNKSLINTRTDFNYDIPSYKQMIIDMKYWIINHKNLYNHYMNF